MTNNLHFSVKGLFLWITTFSLSLTVLISTWRSDELFFYLPVIGAFLGGFLGAAFQYLARGHRKIVHGSLVGTAIGFFITLVPIWGWIRFE